MAELLKPWTQGVLRFQVILLAAWGLLSHGAWAQTNAPGTTPAAPDVASVEELLRRQAELIQKLTERLEVVERQQAVREQDSQKAHQAEVQRLMERIGQLEGKVGSLEGARVLPEIAVAPEEGPTTAELEQQIKILERNSELAAEAAEERVREQPRLSVGQNGVYLSSADTNFVLRLRGLVQLDSRSFVNDSPLNEGNGGFVLRRARPIFEGTLHRDFDFAIAPDFGNNQIQLFDAFVNYRNRPELQLRAGKFKTPVGWEMLQSAANLQFNERSLATDLLPNRDVGAQIWGQYDRWGLQYAVGLFNGAGDGDISSNLAFDDAPEFAGRIFGQPLKQAAFKPVQGLGLGIAGTFTQVSSNAAGLPNNIGGSVPGYWTAGQQQFFAYNPLVGPVVADGTHWRLAPQFSYYWGPFGFNGEYSIAHQSVYNSSTFRSANLRHTAWNIGAQWVITGEDATYGPLIPKRPFSLQSAGWGAWQLVARYGQLDIDDDAFPAFSDPTMSASGAQTWSVGVNWWLNRNLRLMTSFSYTMFDGGGGPFNPFVPGTALPPNTVTTQPESVFFTRLQLGF